MTGDDFDDVDDVEDIRTSMDFVRDAEISLRREITALKIENERLRRENIDLMGKWVSALDLASHRQLLLALAGALPEQKAASVNV